MLKQFFVRVAFVISLFSLVNSVQAQTMSNSQYKLKMGNFNSISGNVSNSSYKLSETSGETGSGLYSGTNYKVKAGFQYARVKIPFSFSLSPTLLDFGVLTPTNPVTRITTLTVSSGSAAGFTVFLSENRPLTSTNSAIADTTCDNGDCNTTKPAFWAGSLTYGFGYRCDPSASSGQVNVCSSDFLNPNFFKPFPVSPALMNVLTSSKGGKSKKSKLTYKVNVSGSQAPGVYTNIVTYIVSPGF